MTAIYFVIENRLDKHDAFRFRTYTFPREAIRIADLNTGAATLSVTMGDSITQIVFCELADFDTAAERHDAMPFIRRACWRAYRDLACASSSVDVDVTWFYRDGMWKRYENQRPTPELLWRGDHDDDDA